MNYYYIEPEVSGGLGCRTIMDRSVHPPIISKLHFDMDGWLGDAILESFPCFVVTQEAKQGLVMMEATGGNFDDVDVTFTDRFKEQYRHRDVPSFAWLRPVGQAGQDDIGVISDGRLVVSERALSLLQKFGIANALIEPFTT